MRALAWLYRATIDPDNFSNFLIMVFTGALTWVGWEQGKLLKRSTEESATAVRIAKRTADAALLSARVAEAALLNGPRPILVVELKEYSSDVIPKEPTESHPIKLRLELVNCGERNAVIESFHVELTTHDRDEQADDPWPAPSIDRFSASLMADDLIPHEITIMPGAKHRAIHTGYVSMNENEIKAMWGLGRRRLLMLILVTYRDPFAVRRERGVTMFFSPLAKFPDQWARMDDPNTPSTG